MLPQQTSRTALFSLYVVLFIDAMGIGILFPLLTKTLVNPASHLLVVSMTGAHRNVLYGIVLGFYFITWFFGAAMLGELSDTTGRKKALLICMAGVAIAYLITAFAFIWHSIALLIVGRIVGGLTAGSQPIAQAAITDVSPANKLTRNIGLVLFAFTTGMVAGPIVGGFLSNNHIISWFSNTTPLYVVTILGTLNFFIILFSFQETSTQYNKIRIHPTKAITIFISAFQHKTIRPLSFAFLLILMGFNSYYIYISVFLLHRFAFSATTIGFYMAIVGVGLSIGTAVLPGWFERHNINVKKVIIGGNIILAIGMFLTALIPDLFLTWSVVIPMAAAFTLGYSFILTLFSKQVPQTEQGWVMGITGAILAFAMAVITPINGLIANINNTMPLYLGTILLLVGVLLFSRFKNCSSKPKSQGNHV